MKCYYLTIVALLMSAQLIARNDTPKLDLGVNFATLFDNREYKNGSDKTIFGSRLTPTLSTSYHRGGYHHKISASMGILREYGNDKRTYEPAAWYTLDTKISDKTRFTLNCGIFPTSLLEEPLPTSFLDEQVKWYKPNIQGLMMKVRNTKLHALLGINWMGQFGATPDTRERFYIFSLARYELDEVLSMGYIFKGTHYANSMIVRGVVDNIVAEPWARMTLNSILGHKSQFALTAGCLLGYQRDRVRDQENIVGARQFPVCGDIQFTLKKWSFAIDNHYYFGQSIMPFYLDTDKAGNIYGKSLYSCDPFFYFDGDRGVYDRLELSWNPRLGKTISLKAASVFHFGKSFLGSQQVLSLYVNI